MVPGFHAEAARLRADGYQVVNPAELKLGPGAIWCDFMRVDLRQMLDTCSTICMLPGYRGSCGARLRAAPGAPTRF